MLADIMYISKSSNSKSTKECQDQKVWGPLLYTTLPIIISDRAAVKQGYPWEAAVLYPLVKNSVAVIAGLSS